MYDIVIGSLNIPDLIVVAIYFGLLFFVGIYSSCMNRGSVSGFFLAGRSMHWIPVGASLFASNIGSGHFIGLAGSAAGSGIGVSIFELTAIFILVMLGWIFAPVYTSSRVYTMPEYLFKRFGGIRIRVYLSVLTLILYVSTKISADLYAGAVFIDQALKIPLYPAVIILLAISALFTVLGGLTAVIWTDAIQTVIMLGGALYVAIISFEAVGGHDNLIRKFFNSIANTSRVYQSSSFEEYFSDIPELFTFNHSKEGDFSECALPPVNAMNLMKPLDDHNLPWVGVIFGLAIQSIWYWCSDQVIVQRVLSARNLTHAKLGVLLAGLIKFLPTYLLVFPGMVARVLFPDEVACNRADTCEKICGKTLGCSDIAYPKLVLSLMPSGARGLMLSVMIASLVSSLTSIFNSASVIFTIDIWKTMRPQANDRELMIIGRVAILIMVAIGIIWIPIVKTSTELFHYIQKITAFLSPPVCAVYMLAISWERLNEKGAFAALIGGLMVGMIRFFMEISFAPTPCGYSSYVPSVITDMHYLHFGILLWAISLCVAWAVSINTEPLPVENTYKKLIWNVHLPYRRELDFGATFIATPKTSITVDETENHFFANNNHMSEIEGSLGDVKKMADQIDPNTRGKSEGWYKRIFIWVCGVEDLKEEVLSPRAIHKRFIEDVKLAELETNVSQESSIEFIMSATAILLTSVSVFMIGFYS